MGDRAVDCARLESVCAERHRGFESPPIRHFRQELQIEFVDRERRFSSPEAIDAIADAITHGSTVLPFKSALLESAVQLRCPIAAACIEYAIDDGSVAEEVCYWLDMTLVPHLLNLFLKREIRANYSFSSAKIRDGDRKQIARELRDEIISIRS
jgi:hypothetical protein